jgi:hypothetical protein
VDAFVSQALPSWQNYYIVVGPAAAALIGIQFVVITLVASQRRAVPMEALRAFASPTVAHLANALAVSALMCIPWAEPVHASLALIVCGLAGLAYGVGIIKRSRRQDYYAPDCGDRFWYMLLPCGLNAALLASALALLAGSEWALLAIGGMALGLLLVGIHNAWDTVTHIVTSLGHETGT